MLTYGVKSCALDSIKVDTSHVFAQVETETRAAEYAKSLKEVIAANGEVAKALDDFLSDNQHRISEQQRFMQDVNSFRSQLARDLEASAREVSDIFKWLTREAGDMTRELMRALSVSMREAQGEAEGLVAVSEQLYYLQTANTVNRSFNMELMTPRVFETQ